MGNVQGDDFVNTVKTACLNKECQAVSQGGRNATIMGQQIDLLYVYSSEQTLCKTDQ